MLSVGLAHAGVEAGRRVYFSTAAELAAKCHKGRHRRTVVPRPTSLVATFAANKAIVDEAAARAASTEVLD